MSNFIPGNNYRAKCIIRHSGGQGGVDFKHANYVTGGARVPARITHMVETIPAGSMLTHVGRFSDIPVFLYSVNSEEGAYLYFDKAAVIGYVAF